MAQRKLLQEVDKVYKKINEGLEVFNDYHDRHEISTNPSQREKLENDLKREIKKLQKSREQIKVWQSTNDIKDKETLLDFRRRVEVAMEKYKVIEKGSKIKAYSNMNLKNQQDVDPSEKEKIECIEFLEEAIEELDRQYETVEFELEKLSGKKVKKSSLKEKEQLKELQSRYRWHQQQLEIALRYLRNGDLEVEELNNIKEDLTYFLENNREVDFVEDEFLYDSLSLDANDIIQSEITQSFVHEPLSTDLLSSTVSNKQEKEPSANGTPVKAKVEPVASSPLPKKSSPTIQGTSNSKKTISTSISSATPVITNLNTVLSHTNTTSSTTATTTTTSAFSLTNSLKPAAPPAQPVNEMKWASLLAPKAEEKTPQPTEAKPVASKSVTPVQNHVETAIPGENTPKPAFVSTTITTTTTTNNNGTTIAQPVNAIDQAQPPVVTPLSSTEITKEESPMILSPVNQEEYFQDQEIINLPAGIQDLLCSFYSARTATNTETNKIDNVSKILNIPRFYQNPPHIVTNVSPIELNRYYSIWNLFRCKLSGIANTKPELWGSLDYNVLFFGYYYNYSKYEKSLVAKELTRRGWLLSSQEDVWFLQADVAPENRRDPTGPQPGSEGVVGNFKMFNPKDWRFNDLVNYKLRYVNLLIPQ